MKYLRIMYMPIGGFEGPLLTDLLLNNFSYEVCEVLPSDVRHPMELLLRNY